MLSTHQKTYHHSRFIQSGSFLKGGTDSYRKIILLPVALHGYRTWSLTLRENIIKEKVVWQRPAEE
jgi:hypothetical protein